jgi:hypothetical protein
MNTNVAMFQLGGFETGGLGTCLGMFKILRNVMQ